MVVQNPSGILDSSNIYTQVPETIFSPLMILTMPTQSSSLVKACRSILAHKWALYGALKWSVVMSLQSLRGEVIQKLHDSIFKGNMMRLGMVLMAQQVYRVG